MTVTPHPLKSEFTHDPGLIYMNHAGVAPIPRRTADVIQKLADHLVRRGASRYPEMEAVYWERARGNLTRLIGAAPEEVGFVLNTSEGLSFIALGLDWKPGDEIVTTDQEFPSNIVVWLDVAQRMGAKVIQVPSGPEGSVSAENILEHVNERTRAVTVSSVQFGSGAAVDLKTIGEGLLGRETLFVVDAIQSLGALALDVNDLHIDALAADGHKWMLGPEGCGLLYLSPKGLQQVTPRVLGWHSVANAGRYDEITTDLRAGIRRFEAGTPNLIGAAALGESVGLLSEAGMATVETRVKALSAALAAGLRDLGCRLHTPVDKQGYPGAGIVIFSHPDHPSESLNQRISEAGLYGAARGAGVRLSPHFYQDDEEVARALEIVEKAVRN